MKCKVCSAEIPSGKLICENCGEEINIVPYFEPELESKMDESLHMISKEVVQNPHKTSHKGQKKKKSYLQWMIILVILSLFIGMCALIYLFNSSRYQANRGNRYAYNGEYEKALRCYEKALDKGTDQPVAIYMDMLTCYKMLGYEGKYEEYLLRVIASRQATENELIAAYSKLINLYIDGKSYQTINNLLKYCENETILDMYKGFMVSEPEFSHEEGEYQNIIPLKILSNEGHAIYYTLDGTDPLVSGELYKGPVFLEDGAYHIKAVCVNKNDVVSDITEKYYRIYFAAE